MSRITGDRSKDGRQGAYELPLGMVTSEWGFDLDTIGFGLDAALDTNKKMVYAKVRFGPFLFAIRFMYGFVRTRTGNGPTA